MKRWLKYHDDRGLCYAYTDRPATGEDRDGSDVWDHYHDLAVEAAMRGDRTLPPLTSADQSYGAACAAFYE